MSSLSQLLHFRKLLSRMDNCLDKARIPPLVSHMTNNIQTPEIDAIFASLADPTRRAVIERLTQGPAPVSELHAPHDMALPTFLKHLSKLEAAGLVRSEKKGRVRTVHIEAAPLEAAQDWLAQQRSAWDSRLDRLQHLAARFETKP